MAKNDYSWRETVWRTAAGKEVKIKDMELGHLVNVLNWVHRLNDKYPDSVRVKMVKEADYRRLLNFAKGEAYPAKVGNDWVVMDPQTGSTTIEKPPEEYIEAVKDNKLYQRLTKEAQSRKIK